MATGGGFGIAAAPPGLGTMLLRMEVEGYEPVEVSLSRFGKAIGNFKPFWQHYFAPEFYRLVIRNFETEGEFVGKWAALSNTPPRFYASWKARHYPGKTILRRTDALFRSLRYYEGSGSTGPEGIFIAEEQSLVLGTAVRYARYHQLGTDRMVARPFLFLARQARSVFGRALHRFAVDTANQEGLNVAAARARGVSSGLL